MNGIIKAGSKPGGSGEYPVQVLDVRRDEDFLRRHLRSDHYPV